MLILAVDTTSEVGGVGIFRDAACLALIPNAGSPDRYSITLFEMVERALAQAHLQLGDIQLYAAANGPGSFTGIRVGLAAGRAWGKVFTRPVRGVSVLEAMVKKHGLGSGEAGRGIRGAEYGGNTCQSPAHGLVGSTEAGDRRETAPAAGSLRSLSAPSPVWYFPILDARRGEFFVAGFRRMGRVAGRGAGAEAERSAAPDEPPTALNTGAEAAPGYEAADQGWVLKPDELRALWQERAADGSAACLLRAHDKAAATFCETLPASVPCVQVAGVLLDAIAALALHEQQSGEPCPNAKLDAYYIRRPDAETKLMGG